MVIDHIGILVKSIENGIKHWQNVFGYQQMTNIVINTRQKVKVVFLEKKNSTTIKLIAPADATSPLFKTAQRGGGLHHLCFKCEDLEIEIERLQEIGLRILSNPQPGEAFENENIVFFYAKQGLNMELIDTDKKASRLSE